ncbi:ankyrin repeat domain-containing protein [Candidatus Dependentiae bacterium]|nr:ankyrin repeat domain-containing protein [Candidatus Dependentiae bacterium]
MKQKLYLLFFLLIFDSLCMFTEFACHKCPEKQLNLNEEIKWDDLYRNEFWYELSKESLKKKNKILRKEFYNNNWNCARLHIAAAIAIGADPNIKKHKTFGDRILYLALLQNDIQLIKFLLKNNTNPNAIINILEPPLFYATTMETAQLLLDHGADPKILACDGSSLLHKLILPAYAPQLLKLFLALGLDPNHQDDLSYTPLHQLCLFLEKYEENSPQLKIKIMALLEAGADLTIKNNKNQTVDQTVDDIWQTGYTGNRFFFLDVIEEFKRSKNTLEEYDDIY